MEKKQKEPIEEEGFLESFSYSDGTRQISLTSGTFNAFELSQMGADFLGFIAPNSTKEKPCYTE